MSFKQLLVFSFAWGLAAAADPLCFPDSFLFGAATSAGQIEGAWNESGRGEAIWDRYTHTYPSKIEDGTNADVACDSYNKYEADVAILKELGSQFYRLSISWSRILPEGTINKINQEGVDYYTQVLQLLTSNGIEPMVTLSHFDLPEKLSELGGWTNPLLVDFFGEYARLCYSLFGQYVKWWLTINEPSTTCLAGYGYALHAPGYYTLGTGIYLCAYTHALAHARAYHIYDDEFRATQGGKVSAAIASSMLRPNTTADEETTSIAMDFEMGLWAHPIYAGDWPEHVKNRTAFRDDLAGLTRRRLPAFTQEEIDYINGTYDYFGLNYYTSGLAYKAANITDNPKDDSYLADRGYLATVKSTWLTSSVSSWLTSVPWGLRELLNWIKVNYNAPDIFVTENGWSDNGENSNDTDRIEYLQVIVQVVLTDEMTQEPSLEYKQGHLCNIYHAIKDDNITVLGHTVWSLMDNWEWGAGYKARFGMVAVDFDDVNKTRTPRESFYWYQNVIANRCIDYDSICSNALNANR